MRLAGRVAVITGAAGGIGAAIARRFASEGAAVHLLDRDAAGVEVLAAELSGAGRLAHAVPCDVSDEGSVGRAARAVLAVDPHPHVLVAAAGVNPAPSPLPDTPPATWDAVLATNATGVFHTVRGFVPHLADGASVVLIASILGLRGARSAAAYSASKGAVIALTRALALDHAPRVRVNAVCPGAVQTPMLEAYLARAPDVEVERRRVLLGIPLGRVGRPEDVAAAALFLAGDDASWVTGQALVVDGGDSI